MNANAMKKRFHHVELFNKPMLYIECRVDWQTVPQGWYVYDVRGSDYDPGEPVSVEDHVGVNHAGTLLSPTPIGYPKGKDYLRIKNKMNFLGEEITIAEFCEEHGLACPTKTTKYALRSLSECERGLFYAQTPEQDEASGAIGHVRIDFGHGGKEFWTTWWARGPQELNCPAFKDELQEIVDELRKTVLSDMAGMRRFCADHGGYMDGGYAPNYGYVVETPDYQYCLRCIPMSGEYNAYLSAYSKEAQQRYAEKDLVGKVSFANGERISFITAEKYLKCIKEELEYRNTTGFHFETLTDDPAVRKAVDDILYDLYGEENPRPLEDYEHQEQTPTTEMRMEGM